MTRYAALAVLLLAACNDPAPPVGNRTEPRSPVPTAPVPTAPANDATPVDPGANESAAADRADTIPIALQGRWTGLKEECGDQAALMELEIGPAQLLFHESEGKVSAVTARSDGDATVTADFTGEGQSWTRKLILTPSQAGTRLTISGDGAATTRKRC
jgi:hypothetical protein